MEIPVPGRCRDNACCESMWARMKSELLYGRYEIEEMTTDELRTGIWRYFISCRNNRRICSANGGLPPMVKRQQYYDSLKGAAQGTKSLRKMCQQILTISDTWKDSIRFLVLLVFSVFSFLQDSGKISRCTCVMTYSKAAMLLSDFTGMEMLFVQPFLPELPRKLSIGVLSRQFPLRLMLLINPCFLQVPESREQYWIVCHFHAWYALSACQVLYKEGARFFRNSFSSSRSLIRF